MPSDLNDSTAHNRPLTVVIGIPSFRRPEGLQRCLESIAAQEIAQLDCQIHVLVAENDLDRQEAIEVVAKLAPNFRFGLHSVLSQARGISEARNALLKHAFQSLNGAVLVMLDDDQWVMPDWLDNMLQTWRSTGAHAVGGRVVPDFMGAAPTWVQQLPLYHRKSRPTGLVPDLVATNGVLLDARILQIIVPPEFDSKYSFIGGGDTEFFMRLKQAGGKFAFCAEAISYESYPPERQTLAWVRKRAERYGMTNMMIRLHHNTSAAYLLGQIGSIAFGFLRGLILFSIFAWSRERREKSLRVLLRAKGQLRAIIGRTFEMYR